MSDIGQRLVTAMEEVLDHVERRPNRVRETSIRVTVPPSVDVAVIRQRSGLSRSAFAARFGFSIATLRKWETGQRQPDRAARAYLSVIAHDPEAVERALRAA